MDIIKKYMISLITTATILSMAFASLAHARKSVKKDSESAISNTLSTFCSQAEPQHHDPLQASAVQACHQVLPAKKLITTVSAVNSTTTHPRHRTFLSNKKPNCRKHRRVSRSNLLYALLPKLPEMKLEMDNISIKLDLDDSGNTSLSQLTLRIGYRNCW